MSVLGNLVTIVFVTASTASSSLATSGARHECLRPCRNDSSSRKVCQYEFIVSELPTANSICNESKVKDDVPRCKDRIPMGSFLGINGRSPGPPIEVCLGDTIEVLLRNKLGTEELSLHWHGLRQKDSVHMDGVPMVTQCPVLPFGGFRYRIKPESTGTYFYHAHSVSQQGDGVYGSLTVRGPQDDPTLERILLLSSRPPTPLTRRLHLYPPTPADLLVNGQNHGTTLSVMQDAQYLLRLINANAYDCPILLSTSDHAFRVQAADGNLVQPVIANHLILFPGERLDVTLKADQRPGKYLLDIIGLRECWGIKHEAFITYDNANSTTIIKNQGIAKGNNKALLEKGYNCNEILPSLVCTLDLKSSVETSSAESHVEEIIYIPFDVNSFTSFTDKMTDNRYNIYECVFYPAYLSVKTGGAKVAQINGVSFKYPSSPILSQPENIAEELICSLDELSAQCADTPLFCECIQIIELPLRKHVEIVLIDEGFGGNTSHVFHAHGYTPSVVGLGSFGRAVSKQEVMRLDRKSKLKRNLLNPPRKDSFVVPNKGYTILRLYTDNPGYWLWEARSSATSSGISAPGMQFLMRAGTRDSLPPVPLNFPTCGNNKGPDLIFEEN